MAPSTRTPMEIAIPARDMMLELMPIQYIGMKARSTETGIVTIGMMAEGMCQRKSRMTKLTMIISTISSCLSVSMDRSINLEWSYVVTISTFEGNDDFRSLSLSLTRRM